MSLDYQRRSTQERRPSVGRRGVECDHSLLDLHKIKISIISGLEENNSNGPVYRVSSSDKSLGWKCDK